MIIIAAVMLCAGGCDNKKEETLSDSRPVYDGYSTYVFFGTDSRAAEDAWKTDDSTGTQGAPSSDVIMLLSVDRESGESKILSVYRDTMLDVAGDGSDFEKCNTAFRESGVYGAVDMLERNLDLNIDGYVTANFMTVADAIDMLGGVEVDIEDEKVTSKHSDVADDVVGVMNQYIKEMNAVYGTDTPLIEDAGRQTLSGMQAVAYSRVRYTEGSDIRRAERQRNVVMLMADRLRASDTATQHKVLKEMYKKVDTDLTESELMDLFDLLVDYDLDNMNGFPYATKWLNDEDKGAMYVPCDLISNVTELHADLYKNDSYRPSSTVAEYDELIKDETGFTAEDADEGEGF